MSLFSTDYNSGSASGGNSGGNYEERDSLKLANYAILSFEVSRLNEYTGSQYGQSVFVDVDDVRVKHGLAYDRFKDDDDDTVKVFGFGKWFQTNEDGTLAEEASEDLINKRISEEFGGEQYPYEYEGHTTEDADEEIELGNMSFSLSNSTKYRTFLKVITEAGHDVIDDKEDDFNWANEDRLSIRDDLEGRRMVLFFKKESFTPDGEDEPITYTDAVVLDANTGAGITIQNGDSDGDDSSDDESEDEDASGTLGGNDDDSLPEGVPEEADEIIDFMARTEETDPESVDQLVSGEADDYDLDAVVEEVERRMD